MIGAHVGPSAPAHIHEPHAESPGKCRYKKLDPEIAKPEQQNAEEDMFGAPKTEAAKNAKNKRVKERNEKIETKL